jgi:hypothetical protein
MEAGGTNTVPFGMKNVQHHDAGEQGDGEEPGDQRGEVPARAETARAWLPLRGVEVDEVAPDREEVADLGHLP